MLRRIPRFLRFSVLAAVLLAVAVSVFQSWSSDTPGTGGWTQTQWGPIGPSDRDLLAKVRMAGLWEQPTGQQAEQQASTPEIREIGRHIAEEHGTLDADVRTVADKLGVLLPTSPSAQQQGWMSEISTKTGADYDRTFVERLREAHGIVLPLIAQARVSTRNSAIRDFATTANEFVSRHIGYLEGTGLVDYSALPAAPSPGLLSGATSWTDLVVPILVFVAALLAAFALVAAMRHRTAARPRRVAVARPQPPVPVTPAATPVLAIPGPRAGPPDISAPFRRVPPADVSGPYSRAAPTDVSGPYSRAAPTDVSVPYRRAALGETTGPYRRPAPGETTGSRRRTSALGEATGPRHSVRH